MTIKDNGLVYEINLATAEASVVAVKNICSKIVIPEKISHYKVVEIANDSFWSVTGVDTIVIPATVHRIGMNAFRNCSVQNIHISDYSPQYSSQPLKDLIIDTCAFKNCYHLKTVKLRKVTSFIGSWAFQNCINLETLSSWDISGTIQSLAFHNCTKLKSFTINGDMHITMEAFKDCQFSTVKDWCSGKLMFDDSFLSNIQDAHIVCHESSPLANLAYSGYNVNIYSF